MKKILFLLLMLMAGIGWTMPPPNNEQILVSREEFEIEQQISVIQPQLIFFQSVADAQEVAFIYRGDYFVNNRGEVSLISHAEFYYKQFNDVGIPQFLSNTNNSIYRLPFVQLHIMNRQNSNFGYPLRAD